MEKTILIDGNNLLYRSFWVANQYGDNFSENDKQDIFIFLRGIKSYADLYSPWSKIICVWDKKLAYPETNFRSEIAPCEYKGGRDDSRFETVFNNVDSIIEILDSIGITSFYPHKMEADDAIAWLAHKEDVETVIISTDKDMLQLVSDTVRVYNPMSKKEYNNSNFENITTFKNSNDYFWFRTFTGDKSDNIPGIFRFGINKYKKLTKNWDYKKTICNIENLDISDEYKQIVRTNFKLMNLHYGYTVYPEETITYKAQYYQLPKKHTPDMKSFFGKCKDMGFKSIYQKPDKWEQSFNYQKRQSIIDCVNNIKERFNND